MNKKSKLKNRYFYELVFLTILPFVGFYVFFKLFTQIGEFGSDFYETQKNNYISFVACYLFFVCVINWGIFKKLKSRKQLISTTIGLNYFFGVFIFFFTWAFCMASIPTLSRANLSSYFRPWWGPLNVILGLCPATIMGVWFYFGTKKSFEDD